MAEVVPEDRGRARFLACWEGGRLVPAADYNLAGTPCAEVADADVVFYRDRVDELFPEDEIVVELGLQSYLAVALRGSDSAHIGHVGVLASEPLERDDEHVAVLRIFAARALQEREAAHRVLAEEQAALRRVATLVTAEAPELLERSPAKSASCWESACNPRDARLRVDATNCSLR